MLKYRKYFLDSCQSSVCPAHFPNLLLVCNGQLCYKPNCLLYNECKVSMGLVHFIDLFSDMTKIYPNHYLIKMCRFRIALKKTFPSCSKPIIGVLHAFLGQESSSNYSLGDMQLHLAINAKRRVAAVRSQQHLNTNNNNGG